MKAKSSGVSVMSEAIRRLREDLRNTRAALEGADPLGTERRGLARRIAAALALHVRNKYGYCEWCSRLASHAKDYVLWPCSTVKALQGNTDE